MLKLYDSLTKTVEPVEPHDGRLSVYVCGVTPYDTTHLGHAFTYVAFDVLVRHLRSAGVMVHHVENVTDIDDDILRKAKELGVPFDELARRETAQFQADMQALNVLDPDAFVPATTVMDQIITAVEGLLDTGAAYRAAENIYFDNRTFPAYGSGVGSDRALMLKLAAEHGGVPGDPNKRDPLDFLLWQHHRDGEPSWQSPFGPGRPGWHIECSTIALEKLGHPIDIHGGGTDLIFPHHASEIAQAETLLHGGQFVRHWMHTAMVRMDGEKMSKSLGNMIFVRDLLRDFSADAIRLYLLSHHYRVPFEWDRDELETSASLASTMAVSVSVTPDVRDEGSSSVSHPIEEMLMDDLRTDTVIESLLAMAREERTESLALASRKVAPVLGLTFKPTAAAVSR